MRAVIQRTNQSSVTSDGGETGRIGKGLTVLLGVGQNDTEKDVQYMVDKITNLRIFEDENDKLNLSLKDIGGSLLVISQFTLYGDARHGRRPSFTEAAPPDEANRLYELFVQDVEALGIPVGTGRFRTHMVVSLDNDGPVTILLDSKKIF